MREDKIYEMYDRQAGTYIKSMENKDYFNLKMKVGEKLAHIISGLTPSSLLDAGTGEGTTLAATLLHMPVKPEKVLAFDVVPNRVAFAKSYLKGHNLDVDVFAAPMSKIPLADNSVDVVTTYHALEPNGGHVMEMVAELKRVAKEWLVLVEPSYQLATQEGKNRMRRLGYAIELEQVMTDLFDHLDWKPWWLDVNPLNPAGVWIAKCSQ